MNSSTSTPSPAWPTHWPKDSFRAWPTIGFILFAIGLGIIVAVIGSFYLALKYADQIRSGIIPIIPAIVLQLVLEAAIVVAVILALPRLTKFTLKELGFGVPSLANVGFALLGTLAMIVIVEGGATLIQTLMHTKQEQEVVQMFRQLRGSNMVFFALFAVVLAPFMEESVFRLFFFNLGLRIGGFWFGAILSGVLFGLAHLQPATWATFFTASIPLMFAGVILSFVYYRTRNAFASMITHGCFNLVTVLAILYFPQLAK